MGFAAFLFLTLYVQKELSYDRHFSHADQLYRVVITAKVGSDEEFSFSTVSSPFAPLVASEISDVEDWCRIWYLGRAEQVSKDEISFLEDNISWMDSSAFRVLDIQLTQGDPKTALTLKQTAVLNQQVANKYFPGEDPVGKEILLNNRYAYTVTGVFKWTDEPTHFPEPPVICSYISLERDDASSLLNNNNNATILVLRKGADPNAINEAFQEIVNRREGEILNAISAYFRPRLEKLQDAHFSSGYMFDYADSGNRQTVMQFGFIAVFILLVASFNYINLTTAVGGSRAKQVGISKTLGAHRSLLVRQFLFESVFITTVAFLLSCLLVVLGMPLFNELSGQSLVFNPFKNLWQIPLLIGFVLFVGILAGSYPAFFLSSWRPVDVLKGQSVSGKRGTKLRSILVTTQFAISTILIIAALVVQQQTAFLRSKDLGFNKEHLLVLQLADDQLREKVDLLKSEVERLPGVERTALSSSVPTMSTNDRVYQIPSDTGEKQDLWMQTLAVGYDFVPTMGFEIIEGRNFDRSMGTDDEVFLVNEAAIKTIGWTTSALGKEISYPYGEGVIRRGPVVGVVRDFHFKSLHSEIEPLLIRLERESSYFLVVRLNPENIQETVNAVEKVWKDLSPQAQFLYQFLDDSYDSFYRDEVRLGGLLQGFTLLAVFIGALGLFALATFAAQQRTKEIGVRKVLGASQVSIVRMLVTTFLRLVLIANIVAWPLSLWVMRGWLQNFPFHINLSLWVFLLAGAISVLLAFVTVAFQALRAATLNPVKSLRYE